MIPTSPLLSKLVCILFSTGSSNSGATLHGGEGGGGVGEGQLYFLHFKLAKRQRGSLGQCRTNFAFPQGSSHAYKSVTQQGVTPGSNTNYANLVKSN